MKCKRFNYFFIGINSIVLCFCVLILFLNPGFISVVHYSTGWLPVITYKTYSSLETNIIYIIIIVLGINILFSWLERCAKIKDILIALNPLTALIIILIILLNPQLIIINPIGSPTRLDFLYVGAIILILMLIAFIFVNILILIMEKRIKKYLIILGLFVGAIIVCGFIHETGHAIFALFSGGRITAFMPFPILIGNEIVGGYVNYAGVPLSLVPLVTLGGEILQWATIIILVLILYYKKSSFPVRVLLKSILIISWLDFPLYTINNMFELPHWFVIGSSYGDIIQFSILTGIPMFIFLILAIFQLIGGALLFLFLGLFNIQILKLD